MDPYGFERLSQRILKESGLEQVEVSGGPNDGGIDGQGVLKVNLISFRVYFQCKKYKGTVSSKEIRSFRGAMEGRGDKGIFMTTGGYTSEAKKEASRVGTNSIDLIGGERICELLRDLKIGVNTEIVIDKKLFYEI
jgi:restriction system protein